MTCANLIVATTQNNEVLNRTVRAVAEEQLDRAGSRSPRACSTRSRSASAPTTPASAAPPTPSARCRCRHAAGRSGAGSSRSGCADDRVRHGTCLLDEYDAADCLVYGIGNVARRDDGLGWAFVDWLEETGRCARAELVRGYQLQLEDADLLRRFRRVLFVDATRDPAVPSYRLERPTPRLESTFTSHALTVPSVLATTQHCFGVLPDVQRARHPRPRLEPGRRGSRPGPPHHLAAAIRGR